MVRPTLALGQAAPTPFSVAHKTYVMSLYRRYLRNSLDWCIRRDVWRDRAIEIRAEFERNRHIANPRELARVIQQAEEALRVNRHPDPYRRACLWNGSDKSGGRGRRSSSRLLALSKARAMAIDPAARAVYTRVVLSLVYGIGTDAGYARASFLSFRFEQHPRRKREQNGAYRAAAHVLLLRLTASLLCSFLPIPTCLARQQGAQHCGTHWWACLCRCLCLCDNMGKGNAG